MPVVRRADLVALVSVLTAVHLSAAGCETRPPTAGTAADTAAGIAAAAERRLAAAALSKRDMPADYLPAESVALFGGLRPAGPACRRLLGLIDGLGGVPRAETAFYQVNPGGAVAERLLRAPAVRAHEFLFAVRRAATECGQVTMRTKSHEIGLRRTPLQVRGAGEESYTVRYAGWVGHRHRCHFDIVVARPGGLLLVLTSVGLLPPRAAAGSARDVAVEIAERAVAKAGGAASIG